MGAGARSSGLLLESSGAEQGRRYYPPMRKQVLALVLSIAGAAGAGATLSCSEVQARDSEVALRLSRLMMSDETYELTIRQMSEGMVKGTQAAGRPLPADFPKKMTLVMREALPLKELQQFNADVYASHFSDKELEDVIAFYKTPTGSKMVKKMPALMQEVGAKMGELLPRRLPELMKKHGLGPQ